MRAIDDDVEPIQTEKRLSRNIEDEHLERLNKRLNEVPQFRAYATAAGIRRAFSAFGRLVKKIAIPTLDLDEINTSPLLPGFAELLE